MGAFFCAEKFGIRSVFFFYDLSQVYLVCCIHLNRFIKWVLYFDFLELAH
ncbi:hypothetical protein CHCC20335_2757 [Bacillus paralicheniformis]|nr:hypothetical protein CHCC20335_2757 [Bacillus paralicheniformis]